VDVECPTLTSRSGVRLSTARTAIAVAARHSDRVHEVTDASGRQASDAFERADRGASAPGEQRPDRVARTPVGLGGPPTGGSFRVSPLGTSSETDPSPYLSG
jgi:hypothetical protein